MDRRAFLRRLGVSVGGAVGVTGLTAALYNQRDSVYHFPEVIYELADYRVDPGIAPNIVIVRGSEPAVMVKAAFDRIGGIEKFISPGDRVAIKPNVAWDRMPEQAANTNPDVVAAVAKACVAARAGSVIVTDCSLNDPHRCFARSGVEEAALNAGAKIWIPSADDYLPTDMKGELLTVWPVASIYQRVDKVINIPVIKHHSLSGATLAQKNWYGVLGGQRNRLHQDIHTSIADLSHALKPTLTVMDGTRSLMRNGPTGGSLADVAATNTIIVGFDEVAIDAFSMSILGLDPTTVGYMKMGQSRGLGVIDWKSGSFDELMV
jgi:uncharacterized protein (DUF362 family)